MPDKKKQDKKKQDVVEVVVESTPQPAPKKKQLLGEVATLHTVLDSLSVMCWLRDTLGGTLYANRPAMEFEAAQQSDLDAPDAVGSALVLSSIWDTRTVIAQGTPLRNQLVVYIDAETNDAHWLHVDHLPQIDAEGVVTSVLICAADVTHAQETEIDLITSREQISVVREALQSALDVLV